MIYYSCTAHNTAFTSKKGSIMKANKNNSHCHTVRLMLSTGILLSLCSLFFFTQSRDDIQKSYSKSSPPTFGKTHFILNKSNDLNSRIPNNSSTPYFNKQQKEPTAHSEDKSHAITHYALFTPQDDIGHALCTYIEQEKSSISIAIYSFTDLKIAESFLHAHKRGVSIAIITDLSCLYDRYNKIEFLAARGVPVSIYRPHNMQGKETSGAMHHKFAIFSNNIKGPKILWNGSFNFTRAASKKNRENVVISDQQELVKSFSDQFQQLQQSSKPLAEIRRQPIGTV